MNLFKTLLAAALAPAIFVNPAHAAATASAAVSIVEITLIDLDLNDGIAASLEVLPLEWGSQSATIYYYTPDNKLMKVEETTKNQFSPLDVQTSAGYLLSGSATTGGTSFDTLHAASSVSVAPSPLANPQASTHSQLRFKLSPNTSISITFDFTTEVNSIPGESKDAEAGAGISISSYWAQRPSPSDVYLGQYYEEDALGNGQGQVGTNRLTGTYSTGQYSGDLHVNMRTYAQVTPVPEPSTYAMMFAGLLVGGAAYARKRRSANGAASDQK